MSEIPVLLFQPWPFPPPTPNPTLRILFPLLIRKGYRFHVVAPAGANASELPWGIEVHPVSFRSRAARFPKHLGHLLYAWELVRLNQRLAARAYQVARDHAIRLILGLSGAVAPAAEGVSQHLGVPGVLKLFGITYFLGYRPTPWQWLQNRENLLAFRSRLQGLILVEDGTGGATAAKRWGFPGKVWIEPQAYPEVWPRRGRYSRESLGISPEQPVLLFVGRLAAIKGVRFLPGILEHLIPSVPWVLVLAGEGPERRALERAFYRRGLGSRIRFLGLVPYEDLGDLYHLASVYLGISPVANVTLPVVEALASGVPVVAFNCQETGRILQTPAVRLVPPFDLQAFARAVNHWLQDPQERQRAAEEARRFARHRFLSWPQVADLEHQAFVELLSHAHS